jgi:amidase/aspartyl-tRNA(Asn)/glutamyl-tRNA(Gln) amidotransferase subunit A
VLATINPEVDAACERAAAAFSSRADAATESSLLSAWRDGVDAYLTVGMSEAYQAHKNWLGPHREKYDQVIWQRFTDAGQWPAQKVAGARFIFDSVRANWRQFFATHDFLVLPCAPFPALTKAQANVEARRGIIALTAPASLGGLPCLTVPVPLKDGLTAGLQIIAAEPTSPVFDWVLKQGR